MSLDPFFRDTLFERIDAIRDEIALDDRCQFAGKRFKDTDFIFKAICGSILTKNDPNASGIINKEIMSLELDYYQVVDGLFDPVIRFTLKQVSAMDFKSETNLDLH